MPQYYLLPKRVVRAVPALHAVAQRLEGLVVRGFLGLLGRLPLPVASRVAYHVFATAGMVTARGRKMIGNLAVAFPERNAMELKRLARGCFGNFGVALAELCHARAIWADRDSRLEWVVDPSIRAVHGGGRPAVFVTGHVGAWQLGNFTGARFDIPITMIYAPESNPVVDAVMCRLRAQLPVKALPRDNVMRQLMRELAGGSSIGMAGDTRLDEGEELPFFGVGALTNTVPARLALRYGCELVPVSVRRLPGYRFRITLHAPVIPDDAEADVSEQARQMTAKLNALYEAWIRAAPSQWACFARRWPKDVTRAQLRDLGMAARVG